jgi:EKC/KEOPS complex subunit CGI121/TPRKB
MHLPLPQLLLDNNSSTVTDMENDLHLFQFNNVQNQKELLGLVKATDSPFPNCTILDRSRIISQFLLQLACTKAFLNLSQNRMKSRSIHTEILLCLSPSNSISDAFKNFGLSSSTKDIFVLLNCSSSTLGQVNTTLNQHIKGERQEIPSFECDIQSVSEVLRAYNRSMDVNEVTLRIWLSQEWRYKVFD